MKLSLFVLFVVSFLIGNSLQAQPGFQGFSFGRGNSDGSKKSVLKELKLSSAQTEEIRSMIADFTLSTKSIQRKIEVLKEDLQFEMLSDKPDKKSVKRILENISEARTEITFKAVEKMDDIKALLTATQIIRLNELRKIERERIDKKRDEAKGDANTENMKQRGNMFKSFSFSTTMMGVENNNAFNPDDVFGYPERELWLDGSRADGMPFGDGNAFNFSFPNDDGFNFSFPNDSMGDGFDSDSPTPPEPKRFKSIPPPDSPTRKPEMDNKDLRKQMQEMNERLKQLEEELKKKEK
ncbi:MAG: hypothetical protein JNJ85_12620 [Candidatus Kapabacteria bacterium]|nr:hypothetical protein [Candidatus Kapabacteria bacterium]MBX7155961.1 hypothetical protein [Bacteroidota bacterium]